MEDNNQPQSNVNPSAMTDDLVVQDNVSLAETKLMERIDGLLGVTKKEVGDIDRDIEKAKKVNSDAEALDRDFSNKGEGELKEIEEEANSQMNEIMEETITGGEKDLDEIDQIVTEGE